jgi:nucleotidyltransferase substrate binding protein (TIGR01987 family)
MSARSVFSLLYALFSYKSVVFVANLYLLPPNYLIINVSYILYREVEPLIFTSMEQDIRWHQRFSNFKKALTQLANAVSLSNERSLSDLEEQGLIQAFEFTHELAWKTIKDFVEDQGTTKIYGSKDATREAFQMGIIENGEGWMEMIISRNESLHTHNKKTADEISGKILQTYFQLFIVFQNKMEDLRSGGKESTFKSK